MKCDICNTDVIFPDQTTTITDSRNIAVKKNNNFICNACNDSLMFFSDISNVKKDKSNVKKDKSIKNNNANTVKKQIKPMYICIKCKVSYGGAICKECKTPNPLFSRNMPRKKKKKK